MRVAEPKTPHKAMLAQLHGLPCVYTRNRSRSTQIRSMASQPTRDIDSLRADTPSTRHLLHFDSAGAALLPRPVTEAVRAFEEVEARRGGYFAVMEQREELDSLYTLLAQLFNCEAEEIAVMTSATDAWAQVFYGLDLREGDRILTTVAEYASNALACLQVAKRTGCTIEVVPVDEDGEVLLPELERLMTQGGRKPALLAVTHVPTCSGRTYDAEAIGAVARRHDVPYLLDACQSAGQLPLDVQAIGCDWMTGTARKYMRGPRGMGFLYASRRAMGRTEPARIDLHGAVWTATGSAAGPGAYELDPTAKRYEMFERSYAAQAGFAAAVRYILALDQRWIAERVAALAAELRAALRGVPGATVRDRGRRLCGIVTFTLEGRSAPSVRDELRAQHINVWKTGLTFTREYFERLGVEEVIRASVHYCNTTDEISKFVDALKALRKAD